MNQKAYPSFSIVVETDNLAIINLQELFRCLDSIASQGELLRRADGVFVADGGVVPEPVLLKLRHRYPWITIVHATDGASYINLKLVGASETGSDVIVFCDGDIAYEPGWLEALLDGFCEHPEADLIAGETSTPISGAYSLAFAMTFNFPRFTGDAMLEPTTTYWANNLAARRSSLLRVPLPDPAELYRGQNLVHTARLLRHAGVILRQPRARGWHAVVPPAKVIQRYYQLGKDAASVRAITSHEGGKAHLGAMAPDRPGHSVVGRVVGRFRQISRSQPAALADLPLAVPILIGMGLAYLTGRILMECRWRYSRP